MNTVTEPICGVERICDAEIVPLEIGDLLLDHGTLRSRLLAGCFAGALREGIEAMQAGQGASRSQGPLPGEVTGFEAVLVCGGRAGHIASIKELAGLSCTLLLGQAGVFAGELGGFELLRARGLVGWVLDLGQSHLKLSTPSTRWVFQRDFERLHPPGRSEPLTVSALRRRLREFVALKLQMAVAETGCRPEALVFALPARLAEDGTPNGSSYDGMQGDRDLLPHIVELSGLTGLPLLVLNDAELAAHSARLDPRLDGFRKVLVITLGFGIGAALIHRPA